MHASEQNPLRDQLLRSAITVFETRGYNGTRVSDIVADAGVAQGTFYLYFKGKEAIFLTLVESFFTRLLGGTLRRFPASKPNNFAELSEQTRQMWRAILVECRNEPILTKLVLRSSRVLGADSQALIDKQFEAIVKSICSYLEELSQRAIIQLENPQLSAWISLGIIERAIHYALVVAPNMDIDELADSLSTTELKGLLVSQKRHER